jgi:hypothetical protein
MTKAQVRKLERITTQLEALENTLAPDTVCELREDMAKAKRLLCSALSIAWRERR